MVSQQSEVKANILFDEGSQRSFLIQELADTLSVQPHYTENICLSLFGSKAPSNQRMNTTQISIRARDGTLLPISVLIVPSIAAPLRSDTQASITELPYLRGFPLAHPVMKFKISLLIGTDHYWDLVEDHIFHGNGPTATSTKFGYLLSGPLPS